MRVLSFVFIAICCCYGSVHAQQPHHVKMGQAQAVNPTFPFILSLTDVEYDVTINLRDQKVIDKYGPLFKKLNIPFTSDAWEDVITGMLQNSDSLMEHEITTSAQQGVLRIGTGGTQYQKAFVDYMLPVFSDPDKLEAVLKKEE